MTPTNPQDPVDVVWMTTAGSKTNDWELRLSLRSFHQHYRSPGANFWVIGVIPQWLDRTLVRCLEWPDPYPRNKDANLLGKAIRLSGEPGLSDCFILCSDDHLLLRDAAPPEFKNWSQGEIAKQAGPKTGEWEKRVIRTGEILRKNGFPSLNFEGHIPYLLRKSWCLDALRFPFGEGDGMTIFSTLLNAARQTPPIINSERVRGWLGKGLTPDQVDQKLAPNLFATLDNGSPENPYIGAVLNCRFKAPAPWELDRAVPRTRLYLNYWVADHPDRRAELEKALQLNADHPEIDEIIILKEATCPLPFEHEKFTSVDTEARCELGRYFQEAASRVKHSHDLSIICNADCFFDAGLDELKTLNTGEIAICLSRHTANHEGVIGRQKSKGHDAWLLTGPIKKVENIEFLLGKGGCDWALGYQLQKAGYKLSNPCRTLLLGHIHNAPGRWHRPMVQQPPGGAAEFVRDLPKVTLAGMALLNLQGDAFAHIIDLEARPRHGAKLREELTAAGINAEIYTATDGRLGNPSGFRIDLKSFMRRSRQRPPTPGEIGLFHTYVRLAKDCIRGLLRPVFPETPEIFLIFEDDATARGGMDVTVIRSLVMQMINWEVDYVLLHAGDNDYRKDGVTRLTVERSCGSRTHAQLISRRAFEVIAEWDFWAAYDGAVGTTWDFKKAVLWGEANYSFRPPEKGLDAIQWERRTCEAHRLSAISFSLYGEDPRYTLGIFENIPLCRRYYPGWDIVVHIPVGHVFADRLQELGAILIEHTPLPNRGGSYWRFETADAAQYQRVVFRDADSRIGPRERAAVDEWIAGGQALHVMRDHANHRNPILGGCFGLVVGRINMGEIIKNWLPSTDYGDDERMLADRVWPLLKEDAMIHTSNSKVGQERAFPLHAACNQYVGERIKPAATSPVSRLEPVSPLGVSKIPRILHTFWLSGDPLGDLQLQCLESWKQHLPDYEIRIWGSEEWPWDASRFPFAQEALDHKQWAFASDVGRLDVLHTHGGVYVDFDVEVKRSFDPLLMCGFFTGTESRRFSVTPYFMGCEAGNSFVRDLVGYYKARSFIGPEGRFDRTSNTSLIHTEMVKRGWASSSEHPVEFHPGHWRFPGYALGKDSSDAYAIHHFQGAWLALPHAAPSSPDTRAKAFGSIYAANKWTYGSGPGSTAEFTVKYREFLTSYLREHKIKSVLDIGCGDWQFSKLIDWGGIDYHGVDIVSTLITTAQREFASEKVRFSVLDCVVDPLPRADLVILKDVLQHLSLSSVISVLDKLKNHPRVMIAHDVDSSRNNRDCVDGGYRLLDMTKPPLKIDARRIFNFSNTPKTVFEWLPAPP